MPLNLDMTKSEEVAAAAEVAWHMAVLQAPVLGRVSEVGKKLWMAGWCDGILEGVRVYKESLLR